MSWYAVGALVVSTALKYNQERQIAKKADRVATNAILQQQRKRDEAAQALKNTTDQLKDSTAAQKTDQAKASYLSDLSSGRQLSTQPATTGALSTAYQQAAGAANDATTARAANDAGLMAITDSAGLQRQAEGNVVGQLGINLSGLGMQSRDAAALGQLKLNGVRGNPWTQLLADGLQAYGSAKLGSSLGTTGTTSSYQNALGSNAGNVLTGDTYTGPGSTSTDYTANIRRLYGNL